MAHRLHNRHCFYYKQFGEYKNDDKIRNDRSNYLS